MRLCVFSLQEMYYVAFHLVASETQILKKPQRILLNSSGQGCQHFYIITLHNLLTSRITLLQKPTIRH